MHKIDWLKRALDDTIFAKKFFIRSGTPILNKEPHKSWSIPVIMTSRFQHILILAAPAAPYALEV